MEVIPEGRELTSFEDTSESTLETGEKTIVIRCALEKLTPKIARDVYSTILSRTVLSRGCPIDWYRITSEANFSDN